MLSHPGLSSGVAIRIGALAVLIAALFVAGCGTSNSTPPPPPQLTVTTTSSQLPAVAVNGNYPMTTLAAANATGSVTWAVTSGALPMGMNLSSAGVLSGTPTQSGAFTFTVTATDSATPPHTATASLAVSVNPALASVMLNQASVTGGTAVTGTVTLTGAAVAGATVMLSSNNAAASVPASATVAAGSSTANFQVTTIGVTTAAAATITATDGVVAKTAGLTVNPPTVASVTLNPTTVTGGTNSTGTVTLTGPAATGGDSVALSSDNAAAQVSGPVVVPAGQATMTFTVTTSSVSSNATANIQATFNSSSKSAPLMVQAPTVASLQLSSNSVIGGTAVTATVTLTSAAAIGGGTVVLSSDNGAAQVSATVTVPAGQTSATFNVTTAAVASNATAHIQATFNSSSKMATLTVQAPTVTSLQLAPNIVTGGTGVTVTATVTLSGPAAAATGDTVTLSSDNTSGATVPTTVVVPAGMSSATFAVAAPAVTATQTAHIQASFNGSSQTAILTNNPPLGLISLALTSNSVLGGSTTQATVTLNQVAGTGGVAVSITSDNAAAQVPSTVTILAGNSSAQFSVTTSAVSGNATSHIQGTVNGSSQQATLTVQAAGVASVMLSQTSVVGGNGITATVTLTGQAGAPSGDTVTLTTTNTAAIVPATATVAAGQTSVTINISTSAVTSTVTGTITASFNGSSQTSLMLSVTPPVDIASVVIAAPASVLGGQGTTGTATLTQPAPTGGAVVSLSSNTPAAAQVPATVTVAAGQTTATFNITTSPVSANTTVTITGSINGTSQSGPLTVQAAGLASVMLSQTSVVGGNGITATVTLTGQAGAPSGDTVTLTTTNTAAIVPATATVAAGQTSVTINISTSAVTSTVTGTITASFNGSSQTSAVLSVTPAASIVSVVVQTPTSVIGGTGTTAVVTLNQAAPTGGTTVNLSSNTPAAAQVPATVTVAAGQTTATFTITTSPVTSNTTVQITALITGSSQTGTVTVQAPTVASVQLSSSSVIGGNSVTATVTLTGQAATGGDTVSISSDNSNAQVPGATVVVPATQSSVQFTVTTSVVMATVTANILANFNGSSKMASLNITAGPAVVSTSVVNFITPLFAGQLFPPGNTNALTINITVTNDAPGDTLTPALTMDANTTFPCTVATCGTIGNITFVSLVNGVGTYTLPYTPPPSTATFIQTSPTLVVNSSLSGSIGSTDSFEVDPAGILVAVFSPNRGGEVYVNANPVDNTRPVGVTIYNDSTRAGVRLAPLTGTGYRCDNISSNQCGTLGTATLAAAGYQTDPITGVLYANFSVQYTPPAALPAAPYNTPRVEAISNADPTRFGSTAFLLDNNPTPQTPIPLMWIFKGTQFKSAALGSANATTVRARIVGDTGPNNTVNWTLTCGTPSVCGSLGTPTVTVNGTTVDSIVTYTPPASVPANPSATITATSQDSGQSDSFTFNIFDATCGSGNEKVLNGQYAFLIRGGVATRGLTAFVGSLTADGAGHITGGRWDQNFSGDTYLSLAFLTTGQGQLPASSYTVGSDNRGCMTLTDTAGDFFTIRFAVGTIVNVPSVGNVATKGRIIRFDEPSWTNRAQSGVIYRQDPSSFATTKLSGDYADGLVGVDSQGGPFSAAGVFHSDGAGNLTGLSADLNDAGCLATLTGSGTPNGTYTLTNAADGRFTATTTATITAIAPCTATTTTATGHSVFYMVSSSQALFMTTDPVSIQPIQTGEIRKQTGRPFAPQALDGKDYVFYVEGIHGGDGGNDTVLGQTTFTTNGNATITFDENKNGTLASTPPTPAVFTIGPNGRTTLSVAGVQQALIYLIDSTSAFIVGASHGESGFVEQQTINPATVTNASLSGQFFIGTEAPTVASGYQSGMATLNGAGGATGSIDHSGPDGRGTDSFSPTMNGGTYSFPNPANNTIGKGTVGTNMIGYVLSGSKAVLISTGADVHIAVVEK